ncbi:MAG: hypothetical protein WAN16_10620 [Chthoniobacterales bacterium]
MSDESNAPADLSNLGIDLSQMFRPSWTTETAGTSDATARLAAKFDEGDRPARGDRHDRQGRPGGRGPRRDGERGPRREGPRNAGPRGNGGQGGEGRDRGSRPEGRRDGQAGGGRGRDDRRGARDPRERRPEPPQQPVLEGWKLDLVSEEPAIEGIAKQVRSRAKAYPLFELARLILQLSDRYSVKLTPESDQTAGLFRVKRDGSLWTSRKEAVNHLLAKHLGQFYRKSSVATEPPKGAFTVVAQCGMSGVLLGPPNHHEYTSRVISLHASRFKNMPFEVYKSRIRMVRDEALIEQWKSEQSTKTIYIPMIPGSEHEAPAAEEPAVAPVAESVITTEAVAATEVAEGTESPASDEITPAAASEESVAAAAPTGEPVPESAESDVAEEQAASEEEVAEEEVAEEEVAEEVVAEEGTAPAASEEGGLSLEQATAHFQEHHAENEVEAAEGEIILSGRAALHDSTQLLRELLLKNLREMDRFPLPLAQAVGKELTGRGLQLFKSHKKIIHVSMARPRYLDREATPISENFRAILEYLEAHPNQRRDKQWTALLALRTETAETAASAAPEGSAETEAAAAVIAETGVTAETTPESAPDAIQATRTPAASATPDAETMKKREQALGVDLLWLLHQGHVIDFAMGNLQAATRPAPKQPSKKDSAAAAAAAAESTDGAVIGNSEEVIVSGSAEHSEIGESDMISEPAEATAEAPAEAIAEAIATTVSSTEEPSRE